MLQRAPRRRRGGNPFRERNPVVIGAVGLGVIAAMLLLAFNIDTLPLLAGKSYSAALSRGRRPQGRRRRAHRRRQGRQGHHASTSTATTSGSTSGSTGRPTSAAATSATVRIKTILGPEVPGPRPGRHGRADERDPAVPHHAGVRRRGGVQRPRHHDRARSTPSSSRPALDTIADHVPGLARRGAGCRRRPRPAVAHHRVARPPAARAARARQRRDRRAGRPQQGARRRCSPTATCCSRSCASAERTSTPCSSAR